MKLTVRGVVPGIDQAAFRDAADAAARGCPISQALDGNVKVELDAQLE
jgi:osmotically inducible protein OsmC